MKTELELLREAFPDRPETGPALSRILLDQVAAGERPATARLSRPGRVVAFGRRDVRAAGYADAVRSARASGFGAMERLTGGRAAAYSERTISLTLTIPDEDPAKRTNRRFEDVSKVVRDAFAMLGIDALIGEVPGEYCPGDFSVNARGEAKLAGIGQRMIKGAAHVGLVIVVSDPDLLREVLDPVYGALGLDWNPGTVGAIGDESPGTGLDAVDAALLDRLEDAYVLRPAVLDADTLRLATERAAEFRSPG